MEMQQCLHATETSSSPIQSQKPAWLLFVLAFSRYIWYLDCDLC